MRKGWNISLKELDEKVAKGNIISYQVTSIAKPAAVVPEAPKKKHKYGANPCEVDGIKFPSTKEANRYKQLLFALKHGKIGQLQRQVPYELNPGGSYSYKYIADFVYIFAESGQTIVEDAKGHRTAEYKRKRRLMKKIHGITIFET